MTVNKLIEKLSAYKNYGDKEVVIQNLHNTSPVHDAYMVTDDNDHVYIMSQDSHDVITGKRKCQCKGGKRNGSS